MSVISAKKELLRGLNESSSVAAWLATTAKKDVARLAEDVGHLSDDVNHLSDIVDSTADYVVDEDAFPSPLQNWLYRQWRGGFKEYFATDVVASWIWTDIDTTFSSGVAVITLPEGMNSFGSIVTLTGDAPPMMLSTNQETINGVSKIIIKSVTLIANKPASSTFNIVLYTLIQGGQ